MSLFSLLFGGSKSRESVTPAPTSSISPELVLSSAKLWAAVDPKRTYHRVEGTGSMLPLFGSNSVLLLEPVRAEDLVPGDIATYDDLHSGSIVHRVREVNSRGAVLFTGDNNDKLSSDGWIAGPRIRWRVAGILYANQKVNPQ